MRRRAHRIQKAAPAVHGDRLTGDKARSVGGQELHGLDQLAGFPPEQVRLVSGAGHFDLIHPDTAAFAIVLEVLETFTRAGDPM